MPHNYRTIPGSQVYDPETIANLQFSEQSGAHKQVNVGPALAPLKYIDTGAVAYTTDASSGIRLDEAGKCLAIYNSDSAVHAVTFGAGTSVPSALGSGVTDSDGNVGIPCAPLKWTYLAADNNFWVISEDSTLMVFLIKDSSSKKVEFSAVVTSASILSPAPEHNKALYV